ncbi:MAG: MopE-related protein [Myxococcota bacterium]
MSARRLAHVLVYLAIAVGPAACTGKEGANDEVDPADSTADEDDCDDARMVYLDADQDGYGTATTMERACDAPAGYVDDDTDCDDAALGVHPGAEEVCDAVDNDCDGTVDVGAVDAVTWYADVDGDGFGDSAVAVVACDGAEDLVAEPTDCDDTLPLVYPGAPELCDGAANDCDSAGEWTVAAEANMASAHDRATDTWTDVTAQVVGSASAAALYEPAGGTTTWFCAGTYFVHISIPNDDTWLVGREGAASTTLDGLADGGGVLEHTANGLRVEGLTLTNGSARYGGALFNGGEATVVDCAFTNNRATLGGGIYNGGPLTVTGTTFSGNVTEGYESGGGGIYSKNTLLVEDSTFTGNTGEDLGGGLAGVADFYTMTVERSTFTGNVSALGGGIASSKMQGVRLVDIVVRGNTATSGGGLSFTDSTTVQLTGSTIAGNTAEEGGGAWLGACLLESDTTDWGSGDDDNTPHDIFAGGPDLPYAGTSDTFSCTGTGGC